MTPSLMFFVDSAKDIAALAPRPILLVDKFSANEASFTVKTNIKAAIISFLTTLICYNLSKF